MIYFNFIKFIINFLNSFSKLIIFLGGALNATLTLLTELVMSGMKGMGFKDLFQVPLLLLLQEV